MNEAFLVALGGVLTVVATAAGALLTALYTYTSKRRVDAISEWRELLGKCNEESTRQGHVLEEAQRAIALLREDHADCHAELGELYVWMARYYDGCCERDEILSQLGRKPRPMPAPPQRRARPERGEYLARTAAQDSALVRAAASPPAGGGK